MMMMEPALHETLSWGGELREIMRRFGSEVTRSVVRPSGGVQLEIQMRAFSKALPESGLLLSMIVPPQYPQTKPTLLPVDRGGHWPQGNLRHIAHEINAPMTLHSAGGLLLLSMLERAVLVVQTLLQNGNIVDASCCAAAPVEEACSSATEVVGTAPEVPYASELPLRKIEVHKNPFDDEENTHCLLSPTGPRQMLQKFPVPTAGELQGSPGSDITSALGDCPSSTSSLEDEKCRQTVSTSASAANSSCAAVPSGSPSVASLVNNRLDSSDDDSDSSSDSSSDNDWDETFVELYRVASQLAVNINQQKQQVAAKVAA
mmetsp:Transcript_63192/g.150695  ORF Transcript_63192/g.150695 Transcript_63192/m.150695 type:complete len:317 (+) Transcript_63192:135-1085(+)